MNRVAALDRVAEQGVTGECHSEEIVARHTRTKEIAARQPLMRVCNHVRVREVGWASVRNRSQLKSKKKKLADALAHTPMAHVRLRTYTDIDRQTHTHTHTLPLKHRPPPSHTHNQGGWPFGGQKKCLMSWRWVVEKGGWGGEWGQGVP